MIYELHVQKLQKREKLGHYATGSVVFPSFTLNFILDKIKRNISVVDYFLNINITKLRFFAVLAFKFGKVEINYGQYYYIKG